MYVTNQILIYVAECLRLLYWSYFKPFTFRRWLKNIHPDLKPDDNPFAKKSEFPNNSRLYRYAWQIWWLNLLAPTCAVLLIAPIYTIVSGSVFNWLGSCLFFLGWSIGLVLGRYRDKYELITFCLFIFLFATAIILNLPFSLGTGIISGIIVATWTISPTEVGLVFLTFGFALGVGENIAGSIAVGLTLGAITGLTLSIGLGSSQNLIFALILSLVFILVLSSSLTLVIIWLFGLAIGLAFGLWLFISFFVSLLRIYFWLPELLCTLIIFLLSRLSPEKNYLPFLPPLFDELIILPLPFIDNILVNAYQNYPEATNETLNYLISSTNQQKVAAKATLEIAGDILTRCQKFSDIINVNNQLTWIPTPTPKSLGSVLPQVLDISQELKAADEATSPYRKYELINSPINNLKNLRNSLAFEKNPAVATKFSSVAERWLVILETAQRNLKEKAEASQEIPHVYIAGNSLDPETAKNRFKGRVDIFREIESLSLAELPPVLLLYGGRRTGKTSALRYLPHRIVPNIIPLMVDLQGAASATTLTGLAENLVKQIIESAQRLPRKIFLYPPDQEVLAKDPFPALQNWLGEIERDFPGKRFLLCLDEYERLGEVVEATNSRVPLNFIRNLLQHQRQWILLFSGAHQLSELPDFWSDYLINTRAIKMNYLQESEAQDLIINPVQEFPAIYEDDAINEIIKITNCQPYLVQLVCYELVEFLNKEIRAKRREPKTVKATADDVKRIIPTVLERGDQYFRELWVNLGESDRAFLSRLLSGISPTPKDRGIIKRLIRKDVVTLDGDAFRVPLVQRFVEETLEEEG